MERVLIIEDNDDNMELIRLIMEATATPRYALPEAPRVLSLPGRKGRTSSSLTYSCPTATGTRS